MKLGAALVGFSLLAVGCGSYVKYGGDDNSGARVVRDAPDGSLLTVSEKTFDHSAFSAVLATFVRGDAAQTTLDYAALSADPIATALLDEYRRRLAVADASALESLPEKVAFWLNAYNASVMSGVLRALSTDPSFRPDGKAFEFFFESAYTVSGVTMSLNELEHGIIRGDYAYPGIDTSALLPDLKRMHGELWGEAAIDARIHIALNCAALSCPNLQRQAWSAMDDAGRDLGGQLEDALKVFLADPDKGAGPNGISSLFSWFQVDFLREADSVEAFIAQRREGGTSGVKIGSCGSDASGKGCLDYDWTLNAAP